LGGLLGHVRQNRLARKSEPTSRITKIRSVSASLWIAPVFPTYDVFHRDTAILRSRIKVVGERMRSAIRSARIVRRIEQGMAFGSM
jgi:hypothetical protein